MATQTTPGGLPFPDGSEKVVDGDNAIRALAEGIDKRPTLVAIAAVQQSIPNNVFTTLTGFTTTVLARGVTFVPATGLATIVTAGLYEIEGYASIQSGGAVGNRTARITKNGTADANAILYDLVSGSSGHQNMTARGFVSLAVGDVIRLQVSQVSGGALPTWINSNVGYETRLTIQYRGNAV
jgi:hypothetical protein